MDQELGDLNISHSALNKFEPSAYQAEFMIGRDSVALLALRGSLGDSRHRGFKSGYTRKERTG